MEERLVYYTSLNYDLKISALSEEDGGGFMAEIPNLPGCCSDGETINEAVANLMEAKKEWMLLALERGIDIPLPQTVLHSGNDYSGKFTLRVPKSLHKELAERAIKEEVSLNQYLNNLISYQLGKKSISDEIKAHVAKMKTINITISPKQKSPDFSTLLKLNQLGWKNQTSNRISELMEEDTHGFTT